MIFSENFLEWNGLQGASMVGSILTSSQWHLCEKSQRSTECRGISPGARVSSHRKCWQGGMGLAPWSFHHSCAPWSDMSHKVAARGALRKSSTRSDWAASFAIQLNSQLQVRLI
jgi:hypothetical protein